ncbi:MAG: hypothetical protein QF471_05990, partial [Phycisphaerales bacterium]|nr:hypothetical protein [Phycisphaerales bacterium]
DEGDMAGFVHDEGTAIKEGIDRIGAYWEANDRLPTTEQGSELIQTLKDPWGQSLRYLLSSGKSFIVSSDGPDEIWQSEYDIRAEVDVSSLTPDEQAQADVPSDGGDWLAWSHPEQTWMQRRQAEIDADEAASSKNAGATADEDIPAPGKFDASIRWDIGGATTMTGASYFWFFTWLMLGTAIVFVPVGCLYRPQTYLQEEAK